MPAGSRLYRHVFNGGLATDLGSLAEITVNDEAKVDTPFLLRAENIYFTLQGGVRKIGGATRYNSTVIESGEQIRGLFEYVRQGTAGSATRQKVLFAGTKIKADGNDGVFADIFTGRVDESVPNFCVFEDELIMSADADEAPVTYDGTTPTTLGGTPPHFAFAVPHANRVWAAGDPANPSRIYYSSLLNSAEWNGAGNSGSIDLDPDDGDVVTGLAPFRGELVCFKGPNLGSIHRIQGLTPSTFSRIVLSRGISAVWQNLIFPLGTDLGFMWSDGTIRTLLATDQFGDYSINSLSREIETLLTRITFSSLKRGCAVTDPSRGYVLFALPYDSETAPNLTLMMDTRFQRPRFATWTAIEASCIARMSDSSSSNRLILYAGGNDGYVRKLQQSARSVDGTEAIAAYAQLPFIHYNNPLLKKTLRGVGLGLQPKGAYDVNFAYSTEDASGQVALSQGGGDVLAPSTFNVFELDSSTLSSDAHRTVWQEVYDCGQFRSVSYEVNNISLDQDMDVQALYAVLEQATIESFE